MKYIHTTLFAISLFFSFDPTHVSASPRNESLSFEKFYAQLHSEKVTGRIIRGLSPEHFEQLSFNPNRRITFLFGYDGFEMLEGKKGYEMLKAIGYRHDFIDTILSQGYTFKIIAFPDHLDATLATWENFFPLFCRAYPEFAQDLLAHQNMLSLLAFEDFEEAAGYKFIEVIQKGDTDMRYMTYERYLNSDRSLLDTRAFLYFTLGLNELYSGDGYAYDYEGNRCMQEYFVLNEHLSALEYYYLIDLEVALPLPILPDGSLRM
ncbi:MAG TPA: hypothetical protein VGP47_06485 [Parachlamydiaceae bacterium]|nr:hypothetical protein [Nitrosopumilus sp.]HEV8052121.1 hypothetical protein [Parachlamydiaceae bacterium]